MVQYTQQGIRDLLAIPVQQEVLVLWEQGSLVILAAPATLETPEILAHRVLDSQVILVAPVTLDPLETLAHRVLVTLAIQVARDKPGQLEILAHRVLA